MGGAFLFALSCNLDTILLAAAFSLRGVALSTPAGLILAAVTTAVTGVALALGGLAGDLWWGGGTTLGGVVLMGMGFWILLDFLRKPQGVEDVPQSSTSYWGIVQLAAALAVNNAGAGAAAGATGLSLPWACGANFAVTLLCLPLGKKLALLGPARRLSRWAIPVSGLLLVLLGGLAFRG